MRRLFQISEKYFGRKLPSGRRAGLKFSSVPTYFSTLFREFVGRYSHTLHDTAGGWTFSAVAPATATLTGANDISDLASGVVYHVDNTAAVSVSLDSQVAGVWTFVIMKTTAAATPKTFSVLDENGPYGLAGAGSIVYGAVDEEHIGKRIVVYGSGTAGTDGYAISETAPPEDIIGEVQVASVDISTLKAGYVYPVAHTAACSLTIGTIATQGMWRFEIAASTDTAAAGFAITLDGTNLASGADVVFGGADDEQFGRVFRVISDGTKAYVDYVAKDIVGATIEGTTAVDVGADCEAGVLYPIDATAGTAGAVTLNLTDKTAGIYKFQIIATTLHATDFPTVTGGPDLYDGSASKVLGGVGPIADFIGQTFTLTCDGTKWSYGSPKKPLYLEDNTVLTSDATNTSIVSFATNGVRIINSAAADAPLTASAGTFSGLVTTSLGLDVSGAALTVTNQAITQTTGGQVTLAGNVDANAGVDVAGANLTCGTFAVTVATGALTTGGGGITSATGTLTDGVASFDGAGELTGAVAITSEEYLGDTDFEASAADGEDDNAGSDVQITSGRGGRDAGGSGGDGGGVVIQASDGANWASSTPGNGGSVEMFAGDGGRVSGAAIEPGGYGGPFDIYSGAGGDGTATRPSGAGGGMTINAGPAGTDNGGGDGGDGVVAIGSENTDSIEIGNDIGDPITKILGDGGIAANHYRSDGDLWVHPNDAEDDQGGNDVTVQAADGGADDGGGGGYGGNATLAGGHGTVDNDAGGIYLTAGEAEGAGDGGNVTINAGDSDSGALGKILIGDDGANSIEIGNAIDTPTLSQLGTGQVAFAGNVNADAGLDVAGAALTVTNQAITQTTGGQVTLAGNVDANAGVDVAGANLTCGTFAVTVGTGALTTGGGGITSATGALGDGVASFDGSGALSAVTTLGMTGALSGATSVSATTLTDGTMTITGGDLATVGAVGCDSVTATGAVEGLSVTDGTATMTTGALDGVTSLSSAQVKQPAVTETAGGAITSFPPGAVSLIDNSAGPVTIAFPAAPATGAIWHLGIKSDTSGANTVTLETDSSGGDLVSGMSGDVVICGARNYAGSSFSIFTDGAKYYCSRFGDASFGDVYGDAATFSAGVAVTGALTATTHTTAPQTFLEDSGAPTADDKNGTMAHRVIKATYDFGVHGGAETSINIGLDNAGVGARAIVIPAGSMIKKTYLYVETAFAATGATNVSFGIATDIDVIAATAFGDALYTVDTVAEGIQDGTPALMEVLAGTVTINIEGTAGAATLTAGRAHLFIEYMTAL